MPRTCSTVDCQRTSCALCHCCSTNFCLNHLKDHQDFLLNELKRLNNDLSVIEQGLESFQLEQMIDCAQKKLEDWRLSCHKQIDEFFQVKSKELATSAHQKVEQQMKKIEQTRIDLNQLIEEQQVTKEDIDKFQRQIYRFDQDFQQMGKTTIQIRFNQQKIPENLVEIGEFRRRPGDLFIDTVPTKKLECSKRDGAPVATNGQIIVVCQKKNFALFDRDFNIVKTIPWSSGEIADMFWSSKLERFVVLHHSEICLIDPEESTIETLQMAAKQDWACGTSSDKSIFLATYQRASSIMEFNLVPTVEFVKQWRSSEICSKEEGIHDISYAKERLLIVVENQSRAKIRFDLRSVFSFDRVWTMSLDNIRNQQVQIRCCSLPNEEWFVAHHDSASLIQVGKDGSLKKRFVFPSAPYFVTTFGNESLLIVTNDSINFHRI